MTDQLFDNGYGFFDRETGEYVIANPATPMPWINLISSGRYSVQLSATGGGYSWIDSQRVRRITRWNQDLIQDDSGRFLYVRENDSPPASLTYQPIPDPDATYETRHGFGYSTFKKETGTLASSLTVFVPPGSGFEIWRVRLRNKTERSMKLELFTYLEWCLGPADAHRELTKCFLHSRFDAQADTLFVTKSVWDVPGEKGKWNQSFPGVGFHGAATGPLSHEIEKREFIGMYRSPANPRLSLRESVPHEGAPDRIAALKRTIDLEPGAEALEIFWTGHAGSESAALREIAPFRGQKFGQTGGDANAAAEACERSLTELRESWARKWAHVQVETPDESVNLLVNRWLPYQVFAAREMAKSSQYCPGGGTGIREIQDALALIPLAPEEARERLLNNMSRQYADGRMPHSWDDVDGSVGKALWSDDMLWTPYVALHYLRETGDDSLLAESVPFLDEGGADFFEHCRLSLDRVLNHISPDGLPLILEGDWNDGLSAVGLHGKGVSVWLAHFLHGLLVEFAGLAEARGEARTAEDWRAEAGRLHAAVNTAGWDGDWYRRAKTDGDRWIGSAGESEGRIFLNAQVWAIMMGTLPEDRRDRMLAALEEHVYTDIGPVLFAPPYSRGDEAIGYLSRYNPGVRENGGVYTHAVNWAIIAEALLGRRDFAWSHYRSIAPPLKGQDPETYQAEPYVTAGNIEGRPSPYSGRGGWTWYTSSGAWFYKAITEYLLGVRPEPNGLRIAPLPPADWKTFRMTRVCRGCTYRITVEHPPEDPRAVRVFLNGEELPDNLVPYQSNETADVRVTGA